MEATNYCPRCDVYGTGPSCWMCSDHRVVIGPLAETRTAHFQRSELWQRASVPILVSR